MKFVEALAMTWNRSVQQAVVELARIDQVKDLTDEQKAACMKLLFDFALDEVKRRGWNRAEKLLAANRNSLHDFSTEIKRPAQRSVQRLDERKTA